MECVTATARRVRPSPSTSTRSSASATSRPPSYRPVPYRSAPYVHGGQKTGLFLRVDNFATVRGRKACDMSKVSQFYQENV